MGRIVCIGELLIDFFTAEVDQSLSEAEFFVKKAGGAPANVCAAAVRLGAEASFCGKVGRDRFGDFLEETLMKYGVNTRYLMKSDLPTTLAFVTRQQGGERDFAFNRGADGDVHSEELANFTFDEVLAHFGSATALIEEPFRGAYMTLMAQLRENGTFISFDPNFRDALWAEREADYLMAVKECVSLADFVKMSEQEYAQFKQYLAGLNLQVTDVSKAVFAVTLGEHGTKLILGKWEQIVPSIEVESVDTTGAGDAFVGGVLYQLVDDNAQEIRKQLIMMRADGASVEAETWQQLIEIVRFANGVGALTCTQIGAMDALPMKKSVLNAIYKTY